MRTKTRVVESTKELSWKPEHNFDEGLEQTVEWYLENQDWVDNVITGEYQDYYRRVYGDD
jgi:dTDP-glucose 4,6-dehydratase